MVVRFKLLILLTLVHLILPLNKASAQGFGPLFRAEIEATFFEGGKISAQKVDRFRANVETTQSEIQKSLTDYYIHVGQKSADEAAKKAASASLPKAFDRLNEIIAALKKSQGNASYELGAAALQLGYAVRSEGRWMDYDEIAGYAKGLFKRYQVKRRNNQQSEASNLWNAAESRFYTQAELMVLKAKGGDLSTLNPIGDGSYWTNVDQTRQPMLDTFQRSAGLYQNVTFEFPSDGETLDFDEVKRSQSRPKFDVTWTSNGKKRKYKLKFLSETNSEATAATLLAALGFNTDASRRINRVKIRFKDGEKAIFHRDLESYYAFWEMQNAVIEDGRDAQGDYLILREALLEGRSDELIRVGAWSYTKTGHPETREVRALPVFMAWIANNDMKESGQNKVILNRNFPAEKMFFTSGDLGWAFGNFLFPESVGWFKWNVIKDVREDSVSFNYLTWQYSDLFQFTTWDDARWMVRLIARLSREQIRAAVLAGQWNPKVENILIEKLVARRNQLVKTFELDKEFPQLSVDGSVAPSDKDSELGWQTDGGMTGGTPPQSHDKLLAMVEAMSRPVFEYLSPSLMSIQVGLMNSAVNRALKPITEIRLTGDDLAGLGLPFAAGIILRVNRSIVRNEQPRSMNERFLVHDQMVIGWTLGTNVVNVGSSITYYRSYNLVYPVRGQSEGAYKAAYLPALLMPFAPGQFKLPNKHSLMIEDYVEGRGTLSVTGHTPVELNASTSLARVYLKRTLISDRADKKVDILIDNSHYTELSARVTAALRAGFVNLSFPFFDGSIRKGSLDRELWTIPTDSPESRNRARQALSLIATAMRTDTLPSIAKRKEIDAEFVSRKWGFNLFNLVTSLDTRTTSNFEERDSETPGVTQNKFQIENISEDYWRAPVLDIQERDTAKSFYMGIKTESGQLKDTILGLNLRQWDSATTSRELKEDSVLLAQKAAADPNFIVFSPELHTNKDQWGAVVTMLDLLIYQNGVDALLAISEEQWWSQFTRLTRIVPTQRRDDTISATEKALVENFRGFLANITRARKIQDERSRAQALTQALGKTAVFTSLTSGIKGDLIGVMLSQLPEESYYLSVKISSPLYKQNIFPTEKPLVNRKGTLKFKDARLHDFSLNTISVIYNFFDSIIPVGSIVPSIDYEY
ncbi:MAG: hypothetical protein RI932_2300 [Pseudomonadota bacterium]